MSCTEMYVVDDKGDVLAADEARNAHRGAMWIWNVLWRKYLLESCDPDKEYERLWALAKNPDVPLLDRVALASTFDNVMIPAEHMELVAQALEQVEPGTENLQKQAAELRKAKAEGYQAFCWNQTSVNSSPWSVQEECPECGCDCMGDFRPYNIHKDLGHWFFKLEPGDEEQT